MACPSIVPLRNDCFDAVRSQPGADAGVTATLVAGPAFGTPSWTTPGLSDAHHWDDTFKAGGFMLLPRGDFYSQGQPPPVNQQVKLGRKAASRAAQSMIYGFARPVFSRSCRSSAGPYDRAIHAEQVPVHAALSVQSHWELFQNAVQRAVAAPQIEPAIRSAPRPVSLRQVTPVFSIQNIAFYNVRPAADLRPRRFRGGSRCLSNCHCWSDRSCRRIASLLASGVRFHAHPSCQEAKASICKGPYLFPNRA